MRTRRAQSKQLTIHIDFVSFSLKKFRIFQNFNSLLIGHPTRLILGDIKFIGKQQRHVYE